jgi:hypothetical protein
MARMILIGEILLALAVCLATGTYVQRTEAAVTINKCRFGSPTVDGKCRGYLTSGTTWTVPADWNNANNTIEVIGGGGGGGANSTGDVGTGGGGGGYAKVTNKTLSGTVGFNIRRRWGWSRRC